MTRAPIALPTLALAGFSLALHGCAIGLTLVGAISPFSGFTLAVIAAYLAFTPLHEAVHGNVGGGLDPIVGVLCGATLFAPFGSFRELHLRHHRHPNDPAQDPDRWVAGGNPLSIALRCLTLLPRYYAAFVHVPEGARRPPLAGTIATQAGFLAALALAFAFGRLGLLLVIWIGAAALASGALAFVFDWLPHHPHDPRSALPARIVDFPGFGILSLGHAWHLAHHLWPNEPFYRYAKVWRQRGAQTSTRLGTSTTARS